MAFRPSQRLRRPPEFPRPYQARRRRPAWWHPVTQWAAAHRLLTGVGATGVACIVVALIAGGFLGHSSTPASSTEAVTFAPLDPTADTSLPPLDLDTAPSADTPMALAATSAELPATTPSRTTRATPRATAPPVAPTTSARPSARPSTSGPVAPTTSATVPVVTTSPPQSIIVHAGDTCSPAGAIAVSDLGTPMVCGTTVTSPTRARWHAV
jgi:hypothetical protein